jgi:hypothetical protein
MRLLLHGVACAILLILLFKIGQLRQIRADNEQVALLIQNNLVESLPIHQAYSTIFKHELERDLPDLICSHCIKVLTQFQDQKNKMDYWVQATGRFVNNPEKLMQGIDSIFQVNYQIAELVSRNRSTASVDFPMYPELFSNQVECQVGRPVALQLLLAVNTGFDKKNIREVPISINHHPVKNNEYQQQFNASGTHPLHIRYQHPKTLDSMTLTYFVNVQ